MGIGGLPPVSTAYRLLIAEHRTQTTE